VLQLIRELEHRKEHELRAQIEKEEIMRSIKDFDRGQLTALERERKKELERLATERENLR
jgi:DNA gyrase/topoisomerase IV subunit A